MSFQRASSGTRRGSGRRRQDRDGSANSGTSSYSVINQSTSFCKYEYEFK